MIDVIKKIEYKRIIWTICTIGLCTIDVVKGTRNGAAWSTAISFIGVAIFPFIILRYSIKDFIKLPFFIWVGCFIISYYPIYIQIKPNTDYDLSYAIALVNVGLYGLVAIRMIYAIKRVLLTFRKSVLACCWLLMVVLCIISVNKAIWPLWFLIMFGGLYCSPNDEEVNSTFTISIIDGIIISFFVYQIHAFLYRPYDEVRYNGFFGNSNVNAMFYLVSFIAFMGRIIYMKKKGDKPIWILLFTFISSSIFIFTFFTGGRIAFFAMLISGIIGCFFLYIYEFEHREIVKKILLYIAMIVISAPLVWLSVRYIPPLRHHPIWFDGEYSENKIHAWDPIDSVKYTKIEDLIGDYIGRFNPLNGENSTAVEDDADRIDTSELDNETNKTVIVESETGGRVIKYVDDVVPGTDSEHPVYLYLEDNKYFSLLGGRLYIYKYYLSELNIWGHEAVYPTVWLTSTYQLYHAHNGFLQMAYCFGVIPGLLFIAIPIIVCIKSIIVIRRMKDKTPWYLYFVMTVELAFFIDGLFECNFLLGKMMLNLFYLMLLPLISNDLNKGENVADAIYASNNI